MPRSNRPRRARRTSPREVPPELDLGRALGGERTESGPDGEWRVRPVAGASTTKSYRCPGCDQLIVPGVPHLVAWPAGAVGPFSGPEERRHWHTPCWAARGRRGRR